MFLIKLWSITLCSAEVTCNQQPVINDPVICTWLLNKQKSHGPPQSLESYPTEWHFQHHQWYNWLILEPERQKTPSEESLISFLWAKHYYSLNHTVQWIIITDQLNWTLCCRACKLVSSADWFMSCESKILRKTYDHSFVLVCVYRPLSIEDYYIKGSLIRGFCVEDKWKTKGKPSAVQSKWENAWWVNILIMVLNIKWKVAFMNKLV